MRNNWYFGVIVLLIVCASLTESKRSFSIGRSRKKSSNINVRRKGATPDVAPKPAPDAPSAPIASHSGPVAAAPAAPIGWNTHNNNPVGPPPAYPGLGHHSVAPHGAPPAYSPSMSNPPSYAAAVGGSSHIGKIPPRGAPTNYGQPGITNFHGLGHGHNAFGGPSHSSGLYNNGMGMGGFSGPGVYGSGYGYGSRSSSPFSFGNILAGLAVWNLARGFNSYNRPEHVYIYDNRQKTTEAQPDVPNVSETAVADGVQSDHSPNVSETQFEAVTPSIADSVSSTVPTTEMPYYYTTIHPSLWIYASGSNAEYVKS